MREYVGAFADSFLASMRSVAAAREERDQSFEQFCLERVRVKDKRARIVPFVPKPAQRAYRAIKESTRASGRPRRWLVLKGRQLGITTYEQVESYHAVVTNPNTLALTVAHVDSVTQRIFRIAKLIHQHDPRCPTMKGTGNAFRLEFPALNSMFFIATAGGSSLRGDTLQRVHASEFAQWGKGPGKLVRQKELLDGLDEAAAHGEVTIETTAFGSEYFKKLWFEAKKGQNDWTPVFLPWWTDPEYRDRIGEQLRSEIEMSLSPSEQLLIEQHGLSFEQLAWRRRAMRRLGSTFPQEYPESDVGAFIVSGAGFFDKVEASYLATIVPDAFSDDPERRGPAEVRKIPGGYEIRWEPPIAGFSYSAGCDTSEGLAHSDPNGVGILHDHSGRQVASVHGQFSPIELAGHAVRLCIDYNRARLGIERENHGTAVIQRVVDLGYSLPDIELVHTNGRAGWSTNAVTRPVMLDGLRAYISPPDQPTGSAAAYIRDRVMLEEALTFNKQRSGKYEADSGAHDDALMKWAIALQVRAMPKPYAGVRVFD